MTHILLWKKSKMAEAHSFPNLFKICRVEFNLSLFLPASPLGSPVNKSYTLLFLGLLPTNEILVGGVGIFWNFLGWLEVLGPIPAETTLGLVIFKNVAILGHPRDYTL